jgi:hypothetical protein
MDVKTFCIAPGLGGFDAFQRRITLTKLKKKQETLKSKPIIQKLFHALFYSFPSKKKRTVGCFSNKFALCKKKTFGPLKANEVEQIILLKPHE